MAKFTTKRALSALFAASMGLNLCAPVFAETAAPQDTKDVPKNELFYDKPASQGTTPGPEGSWAGSYPDANKWQQLTLPIGNSRMGANIFGEYDKERLTFNEKTVWNGGPSDRRPNYNGGNKTTANGKPMAEHYKDVVEAFKTNASNKDNLANQLVGEQDGYGSYQLLGDIYLDFDHTDVWEEYWGKYWASAAKIDDRDSSITYTNWSNWDKSGWHNDTEKFTTTVGAELTMTFTGIGVRMIGASNADMGSIDVYLDGQKVLADHVLSGSGGDGSVLFSLTDLEDGEHTLRVVNKGGGNQNKISYDCFEIRQSTVTGPSETIVDLNKNNAAKTGIVYEGNWSTYDRSNDSDGASWVNKDEMNITSASSATKITYTFTGTGIALYGAKNGDPNANSGSFTWSVDGSEPQTVSLYRDEHSILRTELFSKKDLSNGKHTVVITGVEKKLTFDNFVVYTAGGETLEKPDLPEPGTAAENYRRWLDIDNAIAGVEYDRSNTHYKREYLASFPDNVIAMKLTAEGTLPLEFDLTFPFALNNPGDVNGKTSSTTVDNNGNMLITGTMNDNGMKLAAKAKVITDANGTVTGKGDKLTVAGASEAVIFISASTDYENDYPTYRSGETIEQVAARVSADVDKAAKKGYEAVRSDHIADYRNIYDRVKLNLGQVKSDKTTDVLLKQYNNNTLPEAERRYLEAELYQYGRYLQIGSTRQGDKLPANLQGVWSIYAGPWTNVPWGGDYHMNVNLQMNYWPTYSTNMAECAIPMIEYEDSLREPGRVTASTYFGIDNSNGQHNGYTAHTQNTPFGWTCPGWVFSWGWSPAAVPWMLQNVYEYYEYTGDLDYLESMIFPMMEEQATLYETLLQEVTYPNGKTRLTMVPAYSPEHGPYTAGNAYENELAWQLFNDCIEAATVLNEKTPGTISEERLAKWADIKERLDPIEIGDSGQIKEWYHETTLGSLGASGHRHMSNLLALFPGDQISIRTPEYIEAAKVSLVERGYESTGWGIGQRINAWARTKDGQTTYLLIKNLFKSGIYNNLWDAHGPFQIDGNFGYTSGVTEMLMQSNAGTIELLPSMPEEWANGSVSGIIGRGNFEISESWADGALKNASFLSKNGGTLTLTNKDIANAVIKDEDGKVITPVKDDSLANTVSFETEKGKTYTLEISAPTDVKVVSVSAPADITVPFGTSLSSLGLPSSVTASLSNGKTASAGVTWNTSNYDGNIAGEYTLEGTLAASASYANPDSVKASIKVTVLPADTRVNLALNKEATSSGTEVSDGRWTADKAFDGIKDTDDSRWSSGQMKNGSTGASDEQTAQWLQVDLGRQCEIESFELSFFKKVYPTDYDVSVSADGTTWTKVAQGRGLDASSETMNPSDVFALDTPAIGRYVRFDFNAINYHAGGNCASVREAEIFGKFAADPQPAKIDTSLLKLAADKAKALDLNEFALSDAKKTAFNELADESKAVEADPASQEEVDQQAAKMNQALLELRRAPSKEALEKLN